MRTFLTVLLSMHLLFIFAQEPKVEVLRTENDTVSIKVTVFSIDGKIAEERFLKKLKDQRGLSKEELFMRGEIVFSQFDSLIQYSYDVDWTVSHIDTFYESKPFYEYADNEIELYGDFSGIESRSGSKQEVVFGIRNGTPQDYKVKFGFDGEFNGEEQLLLNRSKREFQAELIVKRGRHEYQLIVKNSNGTERKAAIEAIGYDLIDNDFAGASEKLVTKKFNFKNKEELYIEVKDNYKLLTIRNKKGNHKIPVSQLLNAIDTTYLEKGKNTLELINLNTGEIKVCRIKVR